MYFILLLFRRTAEVAPDTRDKGQHCVHIMHICIAHANM